MGSRWDLQGSAYQQSHRCILSLSSEEPKIPLLAAQRKKPRAADLKNAGNFCASVRASLRPHHSLSELIEHTEFCQDRSSPLGDVVESPPSFTSWDQCQALLAVPEPPGVVLCYVIHLPCASPVFPLSQGSPRATTAEAPKIIVHRACLAHHMASS